MNCKLSKRKFCSGPSSNVFAAHAIRYLVLCVWVVSVTGCASVFDSSSSNSSKSKSKKKESWSLFKKKEYQEPRSLVTTWTEDTLLQPGKPLTRGFGGRLYFYNERSQAIPVDGELVVYGFDDTNAVATNPMEHVTPSPSDQTNNQADKKFRFTAEQFTQHFSQGDLGASYSVWIPWDAVGGQQRKITLIPCFVTKDGRTVRGEASKLVLSGKATVVTKSDTTNNPIQLASANLPTNDTSAALAILAADPSLRPLSESSSPMTASSSLGNTQPLGLNTTTIRLGHNTGRSSTLASGAPLTIPSNYQPQALQMSPAQMQMSQMQMGQMQMGQMQMNHNMQPTQLLPTATPIPASLPASLTTPVVVPTSATNLLPVPSRGLPPTNWLVH